LTPEERITLQAEEIKQLQQENEQLQAQLDEWKYNAKCDADHIAALTTDKDEQAGTIMRLDNGLKKLRSSLQWLKETIHDLDYRAWAEDNIGKIDALLGGKEDV
jgi:chromosome segregation ATPase